METLTKNFDKNMAIKWCVILLCTVMIFLIPVNETFTWTIKGFFMITVFGILCFALSTLPMIILAIYFPAMFWLFQIAPAAQCFSSWSNDSVWMMFFCLVTGLALDQTGVLKRIIYFMMEKLGGSITAFCYGITLICAAGMYIGVSVSSVMIFVVWALARSLDIKAGSKAGAFLFFTLMIANSAMGTMLTYDPMFSICVTAGAGVVETLGLSIDPSIFNVTYYEYALHNLVFLPEVFLLIFIASKIFKPEPGVSMSKEMFREERKKLGPVQSKEKLAILPVVVMFLAFATQSLTGLTVSQCYAVTALVCFLPYIGIGTADVFKNFNYPIIFFIAGCLTIGVVANSCGAGALVSEMVKPFVGTTPLTACGSLYVIGYLLNFLLTPVAASAVFAGPLTTLAINSGLNPIACYYVFIQGLNNLLLPYEGATYMMLFSFGYMTTKQFMKICSVKAVVMLLWLLVFALPYWHFIGLWFL